MDSNIFLLLFESLAGLIPLFYLFVYLPQTVIILLGTLGLINLTKFILNKKFKINSKINLKKSFYYLTTYICLAILTIIHPLFSPTLLIPVLIITWFFHRNIQIEKKITYWPIYVSIITTYLIICYSAGTVTCGALLVNPYPDLVSYHVPSNFPGSKCGQFITTPVLFIKVYIQYIIIFYLLPSVWLIVIIRLILQIYQIIKPNLNKKIF